MGLAERILKAGNETKLFISILGEQLLDFYLNAEVLKDDKGKYIHGPVVPTRDPESNKPVYKKRLEILADQTLKITEADAKIVIKNAQEKIEEYEEQGLTILNKDDFYIKQG